MIRIWAPLICSVGSLSVFGLRWPGLVFAFPSILAAVFLLSLAEMETLPEGFRYRRLLSWKPFRGADLLKVSSAGAGAIGFVKLNRFVPPWGRLYFVLDGSFYENPFRPKESELLRRLRESATGREELLLASSAVEAPSALRLLATVAVGALVSVLSLLLSSDSLPIDLDKTGFPWWAVAPQRILRLLLSWPWIGILIGAYAVALVVRRKRTDAWIIAFVFGLLLPALIFHGR